MRKQVLLICLALIMPGMTAGVMGQGKGLSVSGVVRDSVTREPIPFLTVFVPNTTVSGLTNERGEFTIKGMPLSTTELAFSHLNYGLKVVWIGSALAKGKDITVFMAPRVIDIGEVKITGDRNRRAENDRKYDLGIFYQFFLGDVKNSECRINNPEALRFRHEGSRIIASAAAPLQITNNRLGYDLSYNLEYFVFNDRRDYHTSGSDISFYSFQGVALYKDMTPPDAATQNKWMKNRAKDFSGSLSHFLSCLYINQLTENGYHVSAVGIPDSLRTGAPAPADKTKKEKQPRPAIDSVFCFNSVTGQSGYLQYLPSSAYPLYRKTRLLENSLRKSLKFNDSILVFKNVSDTLFRYDDAVTLFYIGNGELEFYSEGDSQIYDGDLLWGSLDAKKKIISMLPMDFLPGAEEK